MASIVGNILTGYICQYVGWEYIFYIYGNHFYQILRVTL